jgi:hypothetical protein
MLNGDVEAQHRQQRQDRSWVEVENVDVGVVLGGSRSYRKSTVVIPLKTSVNR